MSGFTYDNDGLDFGKVHASKASATKPGLGRRGMILEAAEGDADPVGLIEDIAGVAGAQTKMNGMAVVTAFADDSDSSFDSFDGYVAGVADADESGDVSDDEEMAHYNDTLEAAYSALIDLGCDADTVESFINDEDDAAGAKIQSYLKEALAASSKSTDEIVSTYGVDTSPVLESAGGFSAKKGRSFKPHSAKAKANHKQARKTARRSAMNFAHRTK